MERLRSAVVLPPLALAIAICFWLYIPFQFSRQMLKIMNVPAEKITGHLLSLSPEVRLYYFPPPAGRLLYGINFPAYVLSNKADELVSRWNLPEVRFTIYDRLRQRPQRYVIRLRELAFFVGVCLQWLWIGTRVDGLTRRSLTIVDRSRVDRSRRGLWIIEVALLLLLAGVLLVECMRCLTANNCTPPDRTIATFGLVWPAVFVILSVLHVRRVLRGPIRQKS